MNILFITSLLPFPVDSGVKYKTLNILKLIARIHKVDFVSFIDDKKDFKHIDKLKKFCRLYYTFYLPLINYRHKLLYLKLILSLSQKHPFLVYKYQSNKMKQKVNELYEKYEYNLIYVEHINMVQYIPEGYKGKIIYDEQDISSIAYASYSLNESNYLLRILYQIESRKLKIYEDNYLHKFNHIFTISELDKKRLLLREIPENKITYLPIPFKSNNIYTFNKDNPIITFIGLLSWTPNFKGILWFIKEIFPKIKEEFPDIKFLIAGKTGKELFRFLKILNDSKISYLGFVDNIEKIYLKTSAVVIPIKEGGGIRLKLLDALSRGMPVVSTTLGAEGIPVTPGKDILIADDPQDFAEAVISVINNKELALNLSRNGLDLVRTHFNKRKTGRVLNKILRKQISLRNGDQIKIGNGQL